MSCNKIKCIRICVLMSLSHGVMGWSVIVVFPGHTHLIFDNSGHKISNLIYPALSAANMVHTIRIEMVNL